MDGEDKTLRCPVDTVDTRMYRYMNMYRSVVFSVINEEGYKES